MGHNIDRRISLLRRGLLLSKQLRKWIAENQSIHKFRCIKLFLAEEREETEIEGLSLRLNNIHCCMILLFLFLSRKTEITVEIILIVVAFECLEHWLQGKHL